MYVLRFHKKNKGKRHLESPHAVLRAQHVDKKKTQTNMKHRGASFRKNVGENRDKEK